MNEYSGSYEIRWSDLDANNHVNYSAYIDAASDLRYRYFAEHGFPPARFEQLGVGPAYIAIHAQFFREVRLGEIVTITFAVSGLSPQGGQWKIHHNIFKSDGKKAVALDLDGVILDLASRKATLPVPELLQIFNLVSRTADFKILPELRRLV